MNWQEHIISDKNVLLGKPTIKGTRLSVEFIIKLLASGWSEEEILENYPRRTFKSSVLLLVRPNRRRAFASRPSGKNNLIICTF